MTGVDFHNGRVDWDDCYHVTEERYAQDKGIQLHEHDLLITKDGTIGKTAVVVDCPEKATLNSGVFVVRAINNEVVPEFLHYVLHSHWFDLFVRNVLTGSTIKHLNQEKFYKFTFEAPDVPTQKKIVEVLESIDAVIDKTREMINKYTLLMKGIVQDALTDNISDKNTVKMGTFAKVLGGKRVPKGSELTIAHTSHPYIRVRDMTKPKVVELTDDFLFVEDARLSERLEAILEEFKNNWAELRKALEHLRRDIKAGRSKENTYGYDASHEMPFLGLLKTEFYGKKTFEELTDEQMTVLKNLTDDILSRFKIETVAVNFWNNVALQQDLRTDIIKKLISPEVKRCVPDVVKRRKDIAQKLMELGYQHFGRDN